MQESAHTLFDGLTPDELAMVRERLRPLHFAPGVVVLAEGEVPSGLYIIQGGSADVLVLDRSGGEHRIAAVGPGEAVGEVALFTGQPASATVRALTPLSVLALSRDELHVVAAACPTLYRNLAALLAYRLTRTNRLALHETRSRVSMLRDTGAPPLLSYALASSLAWHTRQSTLLLVVGGDDLPAGLAPFMTVTVPRPALLAGTPTPVTMLAASDGAGAHVALVRPTGGETVALTVLVERLSATYDHLLILDRGTSLPGVGTRLIHLEGVPAATQAPAVGQQGTTIRAWTASVAGWLPRPDAHGILSVPALSAADEQALQRGLLPPATPAGRALGWAARDLAGLRVGLAFGAGGTKGYAHIGVWRILARAGLTADCVAGTSIGAAVAALYALGYTPEAAARLLDEVGDAAWRPTLPLTSLLSSTKVHASLRRIVGDRRIEDLPLPLAVVAADLTARREVVFRQGLLRSAVLASMAIPGIYPPVRIGQALLVDGGVLNPVPSDVAASLGADIVIAVKLSRQPAPTAATERAGERGRRGPAVVHTIIRSIEMMQSQITTHAAAAATIQIEPALVEPGDAGLRNFRQARSLIAPGEQAAEAALGRIAAALPWMRN